MCTHSKKRKKERKRENEREVLQCVSFHPVASPVASSARRKSLVYDESKGGEGKEGAALGTGWEIFCQFK